MKHSVSVRVEQISLPTYLPAPPDKNPMFLEQRIYQGSSGKVYPLPFTDRIVERAVERKWNVIWLENEFLRVLVLPEIGGRIHAILDKTNGYDLIYRQRVIKPALFLQAQAHLGLGNKTTAVPSGPPARSESCTSCRHASDVPIAATPSIMALKKMFSNGSGPSSLPHHQIH